MAVFQQKGQVPHTRWINLEGNDIMVECAILKEDTFGNLHYIEIPNLDDIDKRRLTKLLVDRNVNNFELWDLMGQKTLNNGVNALQYFHQLVKVITPEGNIMDPREGHIGVGKMVAGTSNVGINAGLVPSTTLTENKKNLPEDNVENTTPANKGKIESGSKVKNKTGK